MGHSLYIYDENGRGAGGGGYGVSALFTADADAVVVAHDAFHHRKFRFPAVFRHQFPQFFFRGKERIQVPARLAGDVAVQHGINVIRAAFIRLYPYAPVCQRFQNPAGDAGLAASAVHSGQQNPGKFFHFCHVAPPPHASLPCASGRRISTQSMPALRQASILISTPPVLPLSLETITAAPVFSMRRRLSSTV